MNLAPLQTALKLALVGGAAWLAWIAWQPERAADPLPAVRSSLPEEQQLWRVVTRKIVWPQGASVLYMQLAGNGVQPLVRSRREPVEMFNFNDPRSIKEHAFAMKVVDAWKEKGVEATLLRNEQGEFTVALGRFFLPEYAEKMNATLTASGKPFVFEKKLTDMPVYFFTWPATSKKEAELLWQKVQQIGAAQPIMMPEKDFVASYGDLTGIELPEISVGELPAQ